MEGALRRGHHLGPVHRLRRLRDRLSPRRHRLRPRGRAATSRSTSRTSSARRTAPTARRAAPAAPAPAPASACGSPRPTTTSSTASASDDEVAGIYGDILLTRASDDMVHQMGQDGGLVSAILIWAIEQGYIDGALTSYLEGGADSGSWKAIPGVATNREEILAGAGSRYTYSANTLALDEAQEKGLSKLALVGMSCQSSVPAGDVDTQDRQDLQADRVQHRPAVLEDLRRRHLRGAVRGQVPAPQVRDREDEHQGRLPDLDARRQLPRGQPQGVPRLDPGGLHPLPRLRRRARRHLHRRHRQGQRLDPHHRPHRPRAARS